MDDCGVMSAMTATTSGRAKFDFQAETCFLQVGSKPKKNTSSLPAHAARNVQEREMRGTTSTTMFHWGAVNSIHFFNLAL